MSHSPERISSYRRHFEDGAGGSLYQVRVTSPSPTRREACLRSASYTRSAAATGMRAEVMGRRTASITRSPRMASLTMGAICYGAGAGVALDLDAAAAENQEFLSTRSSERQEMVVLNDRLAAYIEKVRTLEQQNRQLEAEIEALQNRFVKPSGLRMLYEEQLREMKRVADQMKRERDMAVAAKDAMAGQLEMLKAKYEEAVEMRKKAELEIEAFRPDVDAATSARIALEKHLENLEAEIEFLRRVHREEIEELMQQIYKASGTVDIAFSVPDLATALKQVQDQYDFIAAKNLQEMDSWYKTKFEDLNHASTKHVESVRGVRQEISGAKKDIQNKERDLEALKTRNETLEAQIRERQEKYKKELEELQAKIDSLKLEMKITKEKIALHLREYQDLLNIKMALEIEITTYRKLIEGEDLRLTGMVQGMSLMSSSMSALSAGTSVGLGSGMGVGLAGGMGVGLGGGSSGGIAGKNERGVIESYSEQAVEMTEKKTVLIS
ncbi:glial fibrillary acidic protein [Anguilla anguilla]|uniref:glial fibrillary acidic protein n=1 Tax=Anguilla anguilla TaxID=7936 RepID=UPI0015B264D5|nr:glial fibrillary acidic protein [Anguilla anguilla]